MKNKFNPIRVGIAIVVFLFLFLFLSNKIITAVANQFFNEKYRIVEIETPDFIENDVPLDNPLRGEYSLGTYLIDDYSDINSIMAKDLEYTYSDENHRLKLLEFNLSNYLNTSLSAQALEQIRQIFTFWSNNGFDYIVRFIYDWNGNGPEYDPDSIDIIKNHMDQVAEIVNEYHSRILTTQGIFVGSWGEMHSSKYINDEDITELMTHWYDVTSNDIYLAVRTPAQRRTILDSFDTVSDVDIYTNSIASRLGLFNDGMLSSETDLGTYSSLESVDNPAVNEKLPKEQELDYQNELCNFVPSGGEICIDTEFSDPDVICDALSQMHISYLNLGPSGNKLTSHIINDGSAWSGHDMKDYLLNHLGYRYMITGLDSSFDTFSDTNVTLDIKIKNLGFAPIYKSCYCKVTMYDTEFDDAYSVYTIDQVKLGDVHADEELAFPLSLSRYSLYSNYDIYIEFFTADNRPIKMANQGLPHIHDVGYYIGNFSLTDASDSVSTKDKVRIYLERFKLNKPLT